MSDGKVSLSQLLSEVGDDNLRFNVVASCLEGTQYAPSKKKNYSRITLGTDEDFTSMMNGKRMGFLIFCDKEKVEAAMERLRQARP